MAVTLSALAGAGQQFFDDNGTPLAGGKLYSYVAGTTTPQATYTSVSGATPHSNPIILNAAGRVATGEIWLTSGQNYKFVLRTSSDVLIATWDNITGVTSTSNAANIVYDPAGIGAVPTTVQAKLRESVNVFDYMTPLQISDAMGTTSSGSDHTAAINTCISENKHSVAGPYKFSISGPIYIVGGVSSPALPKIHAGKTFEMSPETRITPTVDTDVFIITKSSNTLSGGIIDCSVLGSAYTKSAILLQASSAALQNSYNNISTRIVNYRKYGGNGIKLDISGDGYIYYNRISCRIAGFAYGIFFSDTSSNEINANTFNCDIDEAQQSVRLKGNGNSFSGVYQATVASVANPELSCVYIDGQSNSFAVMVYDAGNPGLVKYAYEFATGSINNIITLGAIVNPAGYIHDSNIMIGRGETGATGRPVENNRIVLPMFAGTGVYVDFNQQQTLPDVEQFYLISPINNILANPNNVTSITATTTNTAENSASYSVATVGKKLLNHNNRIDYYWYKATTIAGGSVDFEITIPSTNVSIIGLSKDFAKTNRCLIQAFVYTTDLGVWTELSPVFPHTSGSNTTAYGTDVVFNVLDTLSFVSARVVTGIKFTVTIPSRTSGTVSDNGYMAVVNYLYASIGVDPAIVPKSNATGYPWIGGDNFAGNVGFSSSTFGPVLTASDGSKWRIVTSTTGALSTVAA
jgi:hypothetical protein